MTDRVWLSAMFCGVLILLSFPSRASPPDQVYPLDLLLTTTSDWTVVRLVGIKLVPDGYDILEGADATALRVSGAPTMAINRAIERGMRVIVRFRVYMVNPSDGLIRIEIDKGHLGSTTVSVRPRGGAVGSAIGTYTHSGVATEGGSANTASFFIHLQQIAAKAAPQPVPAPSASSLGGQKVLAFYYPWYGTPNGPSGRWVHWNPLRSDMESTHIPAAGYYDSLDPSTIRRHIREAKSAGVDGFIASWWGLNSFEDRALALLLSIAEQESFLVTIYYEDAAQPGQIVDDLSIALSRYGRSPAFLTVDGTPVVFFYVRVVSKFNLDQWKWVFEELDNRGHAVFPIADSLDPTYLSAFRGLHTYNPVGVQLEALGQQYRAASLVARMQDALFAATVLPGYKEAVYRLNSPVLDRKNGSTYRVYWRVACASRAHWVLITSFNEWHEGSEIEPSLEFGTYYLEETQREAALWRSGCVAR